MLEGVQLAHRQAALADVPRRAAPVGQRVELVRPQHPAQLLVRGSKQTPQLRLRLVRSCSQHIWGGIAPKELWSALTSAWLPSEVKAASVAGAEKRQGTSTRRPPMRT